MNMIMTRDELNTAKKKADADFRAFLKTPTAASPQAIIQTIKALFFPVLYAMAQSSTHFRFKESEKADKISDLVTDSMEALIKKIAEGKFNFKGNSAFSTYLFAFMKFKYRDEIKITFPTAVKRMGEAGTDTYFQYIIEGLSIGEVRHKIREKHIISIGRFNEIIEVCRRFENKRANVTLSYDAIIENPDSDYDPAITASAEEEYLAKCENGPREKKLEAALRFIDNDLTTRDREIAEQAWFPGDSKIDKKYTPDVRRIRKQIRNSVYRHVG